MKEALKKIDYPLLIATLVLSAFGLLMIFSASSISAVLQYGSTEYHFFTRQAFWLAASLIFAFIFIRFPIEKYQKISRLGILGILVALILLKMYGTFTNSAQSWFRFGVISIQPSEFAKTAIIIYMACLYGKKKKFNTVYDTLIPLIPCVIIFFLVAMEPDLGSAAIIAIITMMLYFTLPFSKSKEFKLLKTIAVAGGFGLILLLNSGYSASFLTSTQSSRLNFSKPCSRYLEETGYQVCNGYIAIHNGGIFGVGLGNSTQKYLYLPESHTDFIFPIIVEELGLIGGASVFIVYLVILFRILVIARNTKDLRGSMIAFGTFAYIIVHITVNMGGLLALIPLTGVPLPFLSYGGSNLLNIFILLTLTQRVCIESKGNRKV